MDDHITDLFKIVFCAIIYTEFSSLEKELTHINNKR